MKQPGRFITIEGIEGVGKTSAVQFIETFFQRSGKELVLTREPGGTRIAEEIRQLLITHQHREPINEDTELLLMFAARAQHLAQVIRPALAAGRYVLSDRFTDASYAYQGGGRGISRARIAMLETWTQGSFRPDLTLLLDAPVEVGLGRMQSRGRPDRIESENRDFFERVRENYLERAAQYPERIIVIDASVPMNEVHEQLQIILRNFLQSS